MSLTIQCHLFSHHQSKLVKVNVNWTSNSENFPPEGVSCPLCPENFISLENLQAHFHKENNRIKEVIKEVEDKIQVTEESLSCEKCNKVFKFRMAKKSHKCGVNLKTEAKKEVKKQDIKSPPIDHPVEDRTKSCKHCDFKIAAHVDECAHVFLKKHYIEEHYLPFFQRWGKAKEFPMTCIKVGCEKLSNDLKSYSLHLGMDHSRLFKAMEKDPRCDMSDVMQVLFRDEFHKKFENGGSITSETASVTSNNNSSIHLNGTSSPAPSNPSPHPQLPPPSGTDTKQICPVCKQVFSPEMGKSYSSKLRHISQHYK